jgi:hypothetical protein
MLKLLMIHHHRTTFPDADDHVTSVIDEDVTEYLYGTSYIEDQLFPQTPPHTNKMSAILEKADLNVDDDDEALVI